MLAVDVVVCCRRLACPKRFRSVVCPGSSSPHIRVEIHCMIRQYYHRTKQREIKTSQALTTPLGEPKTRKLHIYCNTLAIFIFQGTLPHASPTLVAWWRCTPRDATKADSKAFGYDGGVTKAPKIVDIHSERDCGVNRYQLPRLLNRSVPPSRRPPSTPTCACRYIYTFYNLLLSYTATLRFIVVVVYRLCSPTPLSFGAFDCETPTDLRRNFLV